MADLDFLCRPGNERGVAIPVMRITYALLKPAHLKAPCKG